MARRKKNKNINRKWWWLKKKYGLSKEQWERIYNDQDGCCFICQRTEAAIRKSRSKVLAVDHCHKTNKIRGLLCGYCNTQLSQFIRDDYKKAIRIVTYLSRYTRYGYAPENLEEKGYLRNVRQLAA